MDLRNLERYGLAEVEAAFTMDGVIAFRFLFLVVFLRRGPGPGLFVLPTPLRPLFRALFPFRSSTPTTLYTTGTSSSTSPLSKLHGLCSLPSDKREPFFNIFRAAWCAERARCQHRSHANSRGNAHKQHQWPAWCL